ncbi:MAG: twin-arginine translocation signal domain-containing protein, partial [Gemmatimonadota bacterium]|nr:twin-arginine translocation signal domain-containing protein [Gemmatimonadota bacterium]
MDFPNPVSRRRFIGGAAATAGILTLSPSELAAMVQGQGQAQAPRRTITEAEYDAIAKLGNNENCWGPPESVTQAMIKAMK